MYKIQKRLCSGVADALARLAIAAVKRHLCSSRSNEAWCDALEFHDGAGHLLLQKWWDLFYPKQLFTHALGRQIKERCICYVHPEKLSFRVPSRSVEPINLSRSCCLHAHSLWSAVDVDPHLVPISDTPEKLSLFRYQNVAPNTWCSPPLSIRHGRQGDAVLPWKGSWMNDGARSRWWWRTTRRPGVEETQPGTINSVYVVLRSYALLLLNHSPCPVPRAR
jgi:hypothetical protein